MVVNTNLQLKIKMIELLPFYKTILPNLQVKNVRDYDLYTIFTMWWDFLHKLWYNATTVRFCLLRIVVLKETSDVRCRNVAEISGGSQTHSHSLCCV